MSHFLLVYDRRTGHLRTVRRFAEDQHEAAVDARFTCEEMTRDEPDVEVVLLSARSERALKRTHGRYFKSLAELAKID
jgi:hypothetical protein